MSGEDSQVKSKHTIECALTSMHLTTPIATSDTFTPHHLLPDREHHHSLNKAHTRILSLTYGKQEGIRSLGVGEDCLVTVWPKKHICPDIRPNSGGVQDEYKILPAPVSQFLAQKTIGRHETSEGPA